MPKSACRAAQPRAGSWLAGPAAGGAARAWGAGFRHEMALVGSVAVGLEGSSVVCSQQGSGWNGCRTGGRSPRGSRRRVAAAFHGTSSPGPGRPPHLVECLRKADFLCSQTLLFQPSINVLSHYSFVKLLFYLKLVFKSSRCCRPSPAPPPRVTHPLRFWVRFLRFGLPAKACAPLPPPRLLERVRVAVLAGPRLSGFAVNRLFFPFR